MMTRRRATRLEKGARHCVDGDPLPATWCLLATPLVGTFDDRVQTVTAAQRAGLSPCSGVIFGMGETDADIVEVALALRELDPNSVPINFLIPFQGTPLGGHWELTPQRCLRILALFRFVFPHVEVRLAGGREIHLRGLQPLALHLANSMLFGDYLTSEGQAGDEDRTMIIDGGLVIEETAEQTLPDARHDLVTIRRRGAGTDQPRTPNGARDYARAVSVAGSRTDTMMEPRRLLRPYPYPSARDVRAGRSSWGTGTASPWVCPRS